MQSEESTERSAVNQKNGNREKCNQSEEVNGENCNSIGRSAMQ
jgi:hypothetical protein